jgi:Domain of unknown function (DUF4838)
MKNSKLVRGLRWLLVVLVGGALLPGCDPPKEDAKAPVRPVDAPLEEPRGAHLTLVANGVPKATIVVMKEAVTAPVEPEPAKLSGVIPLPTKIAGAANELQVYVQKMSGAKLPIVGDDKNPQGPLILVGRSALTKDFDAKIPSGLTPQRAEEGFLILAKGDRLVLAGNDAAPYHGTEYAVANFLHRQGVRWYMPSAFGEVVPQRRSIFAAEIEFLSKPDFKLRTWWGAASPQSQVLEYHWKLRNGLNPTGNLIAMPGDSSARGVLPTPAERMKDKSLDEIMGKDEKGQVQEGMPNLTNPKSVAYAAEKVKEFFRKNPTESSYGIAPDDGFPRDFTKAAVERNLGFPDVGGRVGVASEMSVTEEWMQWIAAVAREVKKEFPDRLITTNGYANRNTPPQGVVFDPDIPIMFAAIWCDTIHAFDNSRSWQMQRQGQMLERWGKLSRNVFLYNYTYYMLASAGAPIPLSRKHAHDMPLYKKWGVIGFANEGRYVAGEQGVFPPYLQARMMWDASLDAKALADEYFANWYGPAAGPARSFWEALENALETTPMLGHEDRILPYVYTPELIAGLERDVSAAEKLATDAWSKPRVHADRLILEHLKGFMAMHRAEFDANFPEAAKQAEYMLKQREPLFATSRSFFDIEPKTGESFGFYYWGTVARRDYYGKMADLTTGKAGDMIKVLPEQARFATDPRDEGRFAGWYEPGFIDRAWKSVLTTVPFYVQGHRDDQGYPYMGAMWYRLDADVPMTAKGRKVMLYAPAVESEAWVWVNGQFIGHREYHEAYERPNPIDMDVTAALKPGERNSIVVRVHTAMNPAAQAGGLTSRLFLYAPK